MKHLKKFNEELVPPQLPGPIINISTEDLIRDVFVDVFEKYNMVESNGIDRGINSYHILESETKVDIIVWTSMSRDINNLKNKVWKDISSAERRANSHGFTITGTCLNKDGYVIAKVNLQSHKNF